MQRAGVAQAYSRVVCGCSVRVHPEDAALVLNNIDTDVHLGHVYRYEVRATDLAGNASPPSAPAQVEVGQSYQSYQS